jgi:hypothetical protein
MSFIDQRHRPLGDALFDEEIILCPGDNIDNRIADGENVKLAVHEGFLLQGLRREWPSRRRKSSLAAPAQPDIERAFASMVPGGLVITHDNPPQARIGKPMRHETTENAPLPAQRISGAAFAGNDKNQFRPQGMVTIQEADQRFMRFRLAHTMQIQPSLGCSVSA